MLSNCRIFANNVVLPTPVGPETMMREFAADSVMASSRRSLASTSIGMGNRKIFEVPDPYRWRLCQKTVVGCHWSAHQKRSNACPSSADRLAKHQGTRLYSGSAAWPS